MNEGECVAKRSKRLRELSEYVQRRTIAWCEALTLLTPLEVERAVALKLGWGYSWERDPEAILLSDGFPRLMLSDGVIAAYARAILLGCLPMPTKEELVVSRVLALLEPISEGEYLWLLANNTVTTDDPPPSQNKICVQNA